MNENAEEENIVNESENVNQDKNLITDSEGIGHSEDMMVMSGVKKLTNTEQEEEDSYSLKG